jgi:broad specificity phosphatase PhoE
VPDLWLVRHGETAWSQTGQHTGRTDIPLTARGERQAELLSRRLKNKTFALILTSPLRRALDTCKLAGQGQAAVLDDDLLEWDYGVYEGRRTDDIRKERPGWSLWTDGCPGGESADDVGARVDRVIARSLQAGGDVALFAHGHVLRVLAARWLELPPAGGRYFALDTASLSVLGQEREQRVIRSWNENYDLVPVP